METEVEELEGEFHEETEAGEEQPVSMLEAMQADNLVPLLAQTEVARIGTDVVREYEIDLASCKEFHEKYDRAMQIAMQVSTPKTFPWPKASNVIYPLLTEAAIQFQARAYPAIIDGSSVVKCRVLGDDSGVPQAGPDGQPVVQQTAEGPQPAWQVPPGAKRDRADRVAAYMNWQFLNDIPGWEEDTDRLLLRLPIVGCVLRKTWHDGMRNQVNSETVSAKDFIVHYDTVSLDRAPRYTHRLRYYPHEIEGFIRAGIWSRVPYDGEDGSDPHSLVEIYEQCRLIDMDDDGLPEPYVVTVTPEGHVARIVACYDADSIFIASQTGGQPVALSEAMQAAKDAAAEGVDVEAALQDIRVVRIERKDYFTKYGFIPNPDGSFYDMGFGTLTDNLGAAVNTIINQLIDAGTLANMQGGFLSGGTKIKGGNMRFTPGEWKRVEGVSSGPLRENILPLQLPGPSPVLFQLLGMLIEAVKQITSVSDILSGNQDSQTAPTTALALIEQGQKVFTAIYQRIHRALGSEAGVVYRLNRDYLDEERYFALNDGEQMQVGRRDFEDRDLDVKPVSDPRAINDRVKMAKAQVLASHNGDPLVNQLEIRKREFEAAGIDNIEALFEVPAPQPDPKMLADAAKSMAEVRAKDAETAKSLLEAAQLAYTLGLSLSDPNIQRQARVMLDEAVALADGVSQQLKEQGNEQPTDGTGAIPGMDQQPSDGGLPPIPEGPSAGGGDAMGV